jgi:hypothetical protein
MPPTPQAYCTSCGSALAPGSAFCDQCGSSTGAPPPPPPSQPEIAQAPRSKRGYCAVIVALVVILGAALCAIGGVLVWRKLQIPAPVATPVEAPVAPTSQPDLPGEPVTPPAATPPVQVAYQHFLDEAHNRLGGKLTVGSPNSTPTRIEVTVTADGQRETLVVLEKFNSGSQATVVVGPKDAGADRSYTLTRGAEGWTITDFQDLEQ